MGACSVMSRLFTERNINMNNQYFDQGDVQDHKGLGILMAVFSILFFIPCIAGNLRQSSYLRFRANQSCLVFLFGVITGIIKSVIGMIPLLGWILGGIIGWVFGVVAFVLLIWNIVNAATEETEGKPLPVIGSIEIIK